MKSTLLALLPFLLISSSATPIENCSKPAKCPKKATFTLHDITYSSQMIYSTPAHLAVSSGTIAFNLTNTAVGYTTHCTASSSQLTDYFYGNIDYTCDAPPPSAGADAAASFTFSKPDGAFTVNETWSCRGDKYKGSGSGVAKLDCKTDFWQNPNWSIGQLYSTTTVSCTPVDLPIPATVSKV